MHVANLWGSMKICLSEFCLRKPIYVCQVQERLQWPERTIIALKSGSSSWTLSFFGNIKKNRELIRKLDIPAKKVKGTRYEHMLIMAAQSNWNETHLKKVRKWQEIPHTSVFTSVLFLPDNEVNSGEWF